MRSKLNYNAFYDNCHYHTLIIIEYLKQNFGDSPVELIRLINILYIMSFDDIIFDVSSYPIFNIDNKVHIFDHKITSFEIPHIKLISGITNGWIITTIINENHEIKRVNTDYDTNNQRYEIVNSRVLKSLPGINDFIMNSYCYYDRLYPYEFKILRDHIIINGDDVLEHRYHNDIFNYPDITSHNLIKTKCQSNHILFLTTDSLYGLGSNVNGKLGLDSIQFTDVPLKININDILDFDSGWEHTLIITKDGLYGTGSNCDGQLAIDISELNIPTKLTHLTDVISVSCGGRYSMCLTNHGLYGFGKNSNGQLGLGDNIDRHYPVKFNLDQIISVHCLNNTTIVRTLDGIYGCGSNRRGQLCLKEKDVLTSMKLISYDFQSNRYQIIV